MLELRATSEYRQEQFGGYFISGAKYMGDGVTGWQLSLQTSPHSPSKHYWLSNGSIYEVSLGFVPTTMSSGPLATLPSLELESIDSAISEWEK